MDGDDDENASDIEIESDLKAYKKDKRQSKASKDELEKEKSDAEKELLELKAQENEKALKMAQSEQDVIRAKLQSLENKVKIQGLGTSDFYHCRSLKIVAKIGSVKN